MGCKVSRSGVDPQGQYPGKFILSRSYSTPIRLGDSEHLLENESYHVVSLISSTYGSLRLDSMPRLEEEGDKAGGKKLADVTLGKTKSSMGTTAAFKPYFSSQGKDLPSSDNACEPMKPLRSSIHHQVETINMWELMDGLDEENVTLKFSRSLVDKSRLSEQVSGKSLPSERSPMFTTIHIVEDLDGAAELRRSPPTESCFKRGFSLEAMVPVRRRHDEFILDSGEVRRTASAMHLRRRSLEMQNNEEAKEFDTRRKRNISRSQEFARPPLAMRKEGVATHHSLSEVPRGVLLKDNGRIATMQADPVLRSPMLRGLGGHERPKLRSGQQSSMSRSAAPDISGLQQKSHLLPLDALPILSSNASECPEAAKAVNSRSNDVPRRAVNPSSLRGRHSEEISVEVITQPAVSTDVLLRATGSSQDVNKTTTTINSTSPITLEIKRKLMQGKGSSAIDRIATLPKTAGRTKLNLNLIPIDKSAPASQQKTGTRNSSLEPRFASTVADELKPGGQKSSLLKSNDVTLSPAKKKSLSIQTTHRTKAAGNHAHSAESANLMHRTLKTPAPGSGSGSTGADDISMSARRAPVKATPDFSTFQQTDRMSSISKRAISNQDLQCAGLLEKSLENSTSSQGATDCSKPSRFSPLLSSTTNVRPLVTVSQGVQVRELDESISSGYELVSQADLAEINLTSGSLSTEKANKHVNTSTGERKAFWSLDSERSDSPPLDPELLASFEEALELFSADDWCSGRVGESDAAISSGSKPDLGTQFWLQGTAQPVPNAAREVTLEKYKSMEDQAKQSYLQSRSVQKATFSKIAPLEIQNEIVNTDYLEKFEKKCPPGGEERCVLYTTSLRGIRKTFEDCSRLRMILQSLNVAIDERDISMHAEFRQELMDLALAGKMVPVPRLFIRGRYIGGEEEVTQFHDEGTLSLVLKELPRQVSRTVCAGCGGVRFIPCKACRGSCKLITEEGVVTCCKQCNENGLSRCPICF